MQRYLVSYTEPHGAGCVSVYAETEDDAQFAAKMRLMFVAKDVNITSVEPHPGPDTLRATPSSSAAHDDDA